MRRTLVSAALTLSLLSAAGCSSGHYDRSQRHVTLCPLSLAPRPSSLVPPPSPQLLCVAVKNVREEDDLLVRLAPLMLLDGFANGRERLHAVSGVVARSVDVMAIPAASRQPFVAKKILFEVHENAVDVRLLLDG